MEKYFKFVVVLILASCSEQYLIEDLAGETVELASESEVVAPASEFNALVEKARWGDGSAYLKLADCYRDGIGVKRDFLKMIGMVSYAYDLGAIQDPDKYLTDLPEDAEFRLLINAICKIEDKKVEEAQSIIDRLVENDSSDGRVFKGILALERGDTLEANRYFQSEFEKGNEFAELLLYIHDWREASNPDNNKLLALAEKNPVASYILARFYSGHNDKGIKDERQAAYYYMKADEMAFLDKRGAQWLLNYYRDGGCMDLSENDLNRLKILSGEEPQHPTVFDERLEDVDEVIEIVDDEYVEELNNN